MKMGRVALASTRDTAAHLRNRRPPNMSYPRQGQEGCRGSEVRSDCTWTMGSTSPIFSHSFPSRPLGMRPGGQTMCGLEPSETSGSEKNMRGSGTYSFHSDPSPEQVGLIT